MASFIAHALITPLISIVYFATDYSHKLLILGLPWGVTAPLFMVLLAIHFKKAGTQEITSSNFRDAQIMEQVIV